MDYNEEREGRRTIMVDSNGYEIIKDEKTYVSPYDMVQKGESDTPKFLEFALGFNKISKFLQNGFNKFASKEQVFLGRDSLGRPYILENGNATDNPRMKAIKKQYAPLIKEGNNIISQANNDIRNVKDLLGDLQGERVRDYEAIAEMYSVLNSMQGSKIQAIKMNMGAIKDIVGFEHKERELELKEAGGGSGMSGGSSDKYIDPLRMFNAIRTDPTGGRNMGNPNMSSEQVEFKPTANAGASQSTFDEQGVNSSINKGSVDNEVSIFNIASESDIKKSDEVETSAKVVEETSAKTYDDFYMDVVDATTSDPDVAINALKLRNGKKEVVRMTRDGSYYYLFVTDVNGSPVDKFINEQSIYSLDGVAENVDRENGITSNNWGEKYTVEFIDVSDVPDFIVRQFKARMGQ